MKFDYVNSIRDQYPKECLYDEFVHMTKLDFVSKLIAEYRNGDASAKHKLPAFCFHASFNGKMRKSENGESSGLVMVDFDKIETAEILAGLVEKVKALAADENYGIMLAHITPSGKGLRIVLKAKKGGHYDNCTTVDSFQRRIAVLLDAEKYMDEVVTDAARLSFCPQHSDIFFVTTRMWTEPKEIDLSFQRSEKPNKDTAASNGHISDLPPVQKDYKGIPLTDIFMKYFTAKGGIPEEGERNAKFYTAARDLRYICDFNPKVIAAHLPDVGLPYDEVLSLCKSACLSSRAAAMPRLLTDILTESAEELNVNEDFETESNEQTGKNTYPIIYRDFVNICPAGFENATLLALLPLLGTLSSRVRARYIDGELHSPSFMTVLSAEQASGKSFMRKIVNFIFADIKEEDAAARTIEATYRQDLKKSKNQKDLPTPPREIVRCVPASISTAKLLQRLDYAGGLHLFSFCEELDTVIKSNNSGAWAQKSDIYRNSFDNAEYGQDYMNEDTYSAVLPVYYNTLFLGTPRQTQKYFRDVENGLVSRTCFATLPDQFGAKMPKAKELNEKSAERIKKQIGVMRAYCGEINLDFLHEPLNQWLENQRLLAVKENNRARDIFRRRSAVIGFRAAMTVAPCYMVQASKNRSTLINFAIYIANLSLEEQLNFAGVQLNDIIENGGKKATRSMDLFKSLPSEFTINDLALMLRKAGMKTPPKAMIYIWKKENLIAQMENKTYQKNEK